MSKTKVAVFVGSLRKDSFNRRLAKAVEKLAPADFEFQHVRIDNLPLYSQDFDGDYPAEPARLKKEVGSGGCPAVRHPGIQPFDPGRAEERDRHRLAALGHEFLRRQAGRRARHLDRRDRHRAGAGSTCATCWPTSTCRRWRSRRSSCR